MGREPLQVFYQPAFRVENYQEERGVEVEDCVKIQLEIFDFLFLHGKTKH